MLAWIACTLLIVACVSELVTSKLSDKIDNLDIGLIYIPGICMILSAILGIIYFVWG